MVIIMDIKSYSKPLLKLAKKAYNNGDIPVSALVIYDGKVIGKGYNTRHKCGSVTGHAEVMAITKAEKYLGDFRLNGAIIITSLMPCKMCSAIIKEARIDKVYYILNNNNVDNLQLENYQQVDYVNDIYMIEYEKLFHKFFKKMR